MFLSKDFIETAEGLIFAIVAQGVEQGKALCFLRYVKKDVGWEKVDTEQANVFLKQYCPDYLHYSSFLDAQLHAVPIARIVKHHQPKQRLQQLLLKNQKDIIEDDLFQLCVLLAQHGLDLNKIGITGSLLVGLQKQSSDIDLVCYERAVFHQCRAITQELIKQGKMQELSNKDWRESYQRRSCELSFSEYVWHEQRKANKAVINGRKFDLNFIDASFRSQAINYQKCGTTTLQCKVVDDAHAFDYPAEFKIDHEQYDTVVCFTATYTGQAVKGEIIEVSGAIEQTLQGLKRIVVGSTREAQGEYIKVIRV
jgi:predicted nucleotidyltransferase